MKKIIALVLALAMILMVGAVFAEPDAEPETPSTGDETPVVNPPAVSADSSISITGLDAGDGVSLYQVFKWVKDEGWKLTEKFASLSNNDTIKKIIASDPSYTLSKSDVEAIHTLALTVQADKTGSVAAGANTYTANVDLGMYLALITPAVPGTIYNPMIVSADYFADGSNTVDSSEKIASSAVAKKETITVEKKSSDITLDVGAPVKFTITTKIPAYAASFTNNVTFEIHDKMSTGLVLIKDTEHEFKVTSDGISYTGEPENGATEFTLVFDGAEIIAKAAEVPVTVEYYAKITNEAQFNINEETNDVEVIFSNNPDDVSSHGHLFDKVKEYTFTIDGRLFGTSDYETGEIVKVGLNQDGSIATAYKPLDNGTEHAALKDAVFGVYKNKNDADAGNGNYYTNPVFSGTVKTDEFGLMTISGLDEGTYFLKELSAPDGYIKDTLTHSFTITAHRKTLEKQTATMDDKCVCTYDIEVVDYYTVAFDGTDKSTYEMTLTGPSITSIKDNTGDVSSEIANTRGVELPSTGGIGTTIFYILGGLLVVGAAVILVARRKAQD